jgi:predicted membrane protein
MKKTSGILWGIALVAIGVILALNALGITNINIFFDGWWTLFFIIPSLIGLFTERDKTCSIIFLCIGVIPLLCYQKVLDFSLLWKLLVPIIIVIVGIRLIIGAVRPGSGRSHSGDTEGWVSGSGSGIFSSAKLDFSGEEFKSTDLNAIFGAVECDLRRAIITGDCVINAKAVFGGITIYVPEGLKIKVRSTAIFGGVDDKTGANRSGEHTLYINDTCAFGGIDIK